MINFGSIGGRRCVSFRVSEDGLVFRRGWRDVAEFMGLKEAVKMGVAITARESFRRFKIARKAWAKRRIGKQLLLSL